jgi:hypothetical protein
LTPDASFASLMMDIHSFRRCNRAAIVHHDANHAHYHIAKAAINLSTEFVVFATPPTLSPPRASHTPRRETLHLVIAPQVTRPPFLKPARPKPTFDTQVFRLTQVELRIARARYGPCFQKHRTSKGGSSSHASDHH